MAELDPRAIVPENHKTIRKLDGSQGVAKLQQVETKTSKEFTPILKAIVELVKHYQEDTNVEEDQRVKNLADLILDRHTALLNTMTKDAGTWAKVKQFIEAKVGDLVLQYSVDNSNSAKDDVKVVTKKINDAITKALIDWNKKNKPKQTSTEEKRIEVIELDKEVVNKKTGKFMQSKEYKSFLGELKSDFEGFVKDYDANRKILITNYKKAIDNNIIKTKKPKQNILTKLTDIFKDKTITKKDRQPKKSLNPFRSFDIKGLSKTVGVGVIAFVGVSAGLIGKFFKGKVFSSAAKLMKNVVYGAIGTMAGMLKGFLNMFGRGPFGMVLSLVLFPIKLIASGLMIVIKPLVKLIKGLANIILAPIKILVVGPIKLLKKFGSFVTGIFSGMLSFLNKRTILSLFKIFLTAGGAFMLGYIIGTAWVKWLKPAYLKISAFFHTVSNFIKRVKDTILGFYDKITGAFKQATDKDSQPRPPTLGWKIKTILEGIKSAWNFLFEIFKFAGQGAFDAYKFFSGIFGNIGGFEALGDIVNIVTSAWFKTLTAVGKVWFKAAKGLKGLKGFPKLIGVACFAIVEAIKGMFSFFSRKKDAPIKLKSQFTSGEQPNVEKATFLNADQKKEYEGLLAGINMEADDLRSLEGMQEEIIEVCKAKNIKLTAYPGYLNKVITSYALGEDNPETLDLPANFESMSLGDQIAAVNDILQQRQKRADQLKGVLLANNKDAVIKLLADRRSNQKALSLGNFKEEMVALTNEGFKGNGRVVLADGTELKAGESITVDRDAVKADPTMLEDMRKAGLIESGDDWYNWGDGEYKIKGDAEAIANFQAIRNARRVQDAIDSLKLGSWYNSQSTFRKDELEIKMKEYFKTADINGKSNAELQKEAFAFAKAAVEGKKEITKEKPNVEKKLEKEVNELNEQADQMDNIDNSNNTTIVEVNNGNYNPATEEVNRQQ